MKRSQQAVLSLWRRVDLRHEERAMARTERAAGAVIPSVLKSLGLDRQRSQAELLRVWNHAIDPTITAHAQPTGIRNGTLFVQVDSSAWLSEIVRYRRKEILARLQHSFGKDFVARISFRLG